MSDQQPRTQIVAHLPDRSHLSEASALRLLIRTLTGDADESHRCIVSRHCSGRSEQRMFSGGTPLLGLPGQCAEAEGRRSADGQSRSLRVAAEQSESESPFLARVVAELSL